MTQHPVSEVLSAYLDGEATVEERREIDAHLAMCAGCRQHLAELRQAAGLVRALEPVPAPEGFRSRIRARLPQERPSFPQLWPLRWRPSWRVLAATAAVVLIGVFSVNLVQQIRPQQASREVAETEHSAAEVARDRGGPNNNLGTTKALEPRSIAQSSTVPGSGRQVIRTATLTIEVADEDEGAKALMRIAESVGGFVATSSTVHEKPSHGYFELRVPAALFAQVLDRIEQIGQVKERQVSGQDVTEEFIDLQARIRNLDRHEHQLLTFMDRATKVSDLLAIEQELARVRGEIEQLTGRLRAMNNRVELATVGVTLREKTQGTGFWDFTAAQGNIKGAFVGSVRQILIAVERLLVVASALVPVGALALIAWFLIRRISGRRLRLGGQEDNR